MFNKQDKSRDEFMLTGKFKKCGYDWWWHSFTARNAITNEEKPFFIEFFICNPKYSSSKPILGQLKENKEKRIKPSYLMIKVGCWKDKAIQLHNFYGLDNVTIHKKKPFCVEANNCYLDEYMTYGKVLVSKEDSINHPEYMSDYGEISWNLKINKKVAFNVGYGASKLFRKMKAFEMFWHAEGMKSSFDGEIYLNGEKYIVSSDNSYGYADKNWGKDFTSPWVWLSSNNLYSIKYNKVLNNSVFDIGGGRPKIGFVALNRKLLSAFYYEGKCYEFNFSKFWTFTRTKFSFEEKDDIVIWHVMQKTLRNKMEVEVTCKKKDMLYVNYEAPNGKKLHNKLWNGGTGEGTIKLYHKGKLVDEIKASNIGCEYGEYDKRK